MVDAQARGHAGPLTNMDRTGIGLVAGAVSAGVSSPSQVIMIQQQKTGLSMLSQVQYLCHHHGWLSLGGGVVSIIHSTYPAVRCPC